MKRSQEETIPHGDEYAGFEIAGQQTFFLTKKAVKHANLLLTLVLYPVREDTPQGQAIVTKLTARHAMPAVFEIIAEYLEHYRDVDEIKSHNSDDHSIVIIDAWEKAYAARIPAFPRLVRKQGGVLGWDMAEVSALTVYNTAHLFGTSTLCNLMAKSIALQLSGKLYPDIARLFRAPPEVDFNLELPEVLHRLAAKKDPAYVRGVKPPYPYWWIRDVTLPDALTKKPINLAEEID
jgi:hypothetical protein